MSGILLNISGRLKGANQVDRPRGYICSQIQCDTYKLELGI